MTAEQHYLPRFGTFFDLTQECVGIATVGCGVDISGKGPLAPPKFTCYIAHPFGGRRLAEMPRISVNRIAVPSNVLQARPAG
jgi:hypothetical protein